jgi:hypothetical protein
VTFGDTFRLTLLTGDPQLAAQADRVGVDRIGVDFERLGKAQRQAGEDTRLSEHNWDDLAAVAPALKRAALFVRVNPINPDSTSEVDRALEHGAQVLMLPFFHAAQEVDAFTRLVRGRAKVVILLETAAAAVRVREIVAVPGIDEVMFGLNDLRLQFGVRNHFEVLASPLLDGLAREVRQAGLPLSVGGIARTDDAALPVSPDLVYAQFPRLDATGAWLSRSFFNGTPPGWDFGEAVVAMRRRLTEWAAAPPIDLKRARDDLAREARAAAAKRPVNRP